MATRASSVSARDGRPPDGVGPENSRAELLVVDDLRRLALVGIIIAGWVVALVVCSNARAQSLGPYYFDLYAAPRGEMTMRPQASAGPFPDVAVCYAAGAIVIDALNAAHPDKDFMGRCDGGILLTGRVIAERALALLPRERGR